MALAVVIPALDEAGQIEGAIESARAPGVEVVVVDGGSADGTRERAAAAGARVLAAPPGRARQLAAGADATGGDTVLFLHADTRLPVGFELAIRDVLEDPETVGGAFRFQFDYGDPGERRDRRSAALRVVEWGARLRAGWFGMPYGDQALFVRRTTLQEIGGVPQAPIMEDLDLVKAMRERGRLALLALPATTSARRYRAGGVWRTAIRHWVALAAWLLRLDRERVAAWYAR